jgi:hypothetical protein
MDLVMVKNPKQRQVKTAPPVDEKSAPRLPHERDESADSQSIAPRKVMQQAAADIESGQVDTDLRNGAGGVENVVQARAAKPADKK